jgi:hypothetical protein
MSAANNGGPAFPVLGTEYNSNYEVRELTTVDSGVSVRDYFAAKAMQACVEGHISHFGHDNHWPPVDVSQYSYELADAMLAERAK